jgi:hypothetical protein
MSTKRSPMFDGRFGRMFRRLDPATFGRSDADNQTNLLALGAAMTSDFDAPKDGPDDEESGNPALYTYLGQFIDHDITFDPVSDLQKQNDPDALTDFRTPALDLDNLYGRGPSDQPYFYDDTGMQFLLGDPIQGGAAGAQDLQRAKNGRALIGDPRNDENAIVSQLQALFLRFHNRMVTDHAGESFGSIQQQVRFHYQFMVLNDFLPRIVHSTVLNELKSGGRYDQGNLEFFKWKNIPFMPVEFSVAAYRLGHSMVRPGYRLNDNVLLPIFPVPTQGLSEGLTGFRPMNNQWAIDWARFIPIASRPNGVALDDQGKVNGKDPSPAQLADNRGRLQLAYRIDTSLVNPLGLLPTPQVVSDSPNSLAARNLLRGWRLGLPSGQNVAKAMDLEPLSDDDILIGKGVDTPDAGSAPTPIVATPNVPAAAFKRNCPLWTYILAEAMHNVEAVQVAPGLTINTPKLGPVGGRIVAEVFLGMMFGSPNSYLSQDPSWTPTISNPFTLTDLVKYALGA